MFLQFYLFAQMGVTGHFLRIKCRILISPLRRLGKTAAMQINFRLLNLKGRSGSDPRTSRLRPWRMDASSLFKNIPFPPSPSPSLPRLLHQSAISTSAESFSFCSPVPVCVRETENTVINREGSIGCALMGQCVTRISSVLLIG